MAWNEPGGGNNKDPWGGRGDQGPPDLDEVVRKMQDKLGGMFGGRKGGGGNGGTTGPGFAGFGLILAALGIYGVISYSVSQRKQEIGIRMALGASAGDVQTRILMQTARLALTGVILGATASWMTARALQGLLFGVTFSDPVTFAAVLAVLAAFAVLAGYLPARRASRLNPLDALHCE